MTTPEKINHPESEYETERLNDWFVRHAINLVLMYIRGLGSINEEFKQKVLTYLKNAAEQIEQIDTTQAENTLSIDIAGLIDSVIIADTERIREQIPSEGEIQAATDCLDMPGFLAVNKLPNLIPLESFRLAFASMEITTQTKLKYFTAGWKWILESGIDVSNIEVFLKTILVYNQLKLLPEKQNNKSRLPRTLLDIAVGNGVPNELIEANISKYKDSIWEQGKCPQQDKVESAVVRSESELIEFLNEIGGPKTTEIYNQEYKFYRLMAEIIGEAQLSKLGKVYIAEIMTDRFLRAIEQVFEFKYGKQLNYSSYYHMFEKGFAQYFAGFENLGPEFVTFLDIVREGLFRKSGESE